jgi:excisionase family DNA binding protein
MKQRIAVLPRRALKQSEAATILGVSPPTLAQIIKEGRLRAFHPTPSSTRILQSDLEEFIRSNATTTENPLMPFGLSPQNENKI